MAAAPKGFPPGYSKSLYVSACTQNAPNLRCFLKRRLTNTPRRHRLADGQLSSLYPPSPSFSSFGAASVMLCCSPPASSGTPSRPCVYYSSIIPVVNVTYISGFCYHINVLCIFDQTCIVLKSGWNSKARVPRLVQRTDPPFLLLPCFASSFLPSLLRSLCLASSFLPFLLRSLCLASSLLPCLASSALPHFHPPSLPPPVHPPSPPPSRQLGSSCKASSS